MILDTDGQKGVRSVRYYRAGLTSNEAESFAIHDTLDYLTKLVHHMPSL